MNDTFISSYRYGNMIWTGSATYNNLRMPYKFINKDVTYITELYNSNNSVIFEYSQDCNVGLKNRPKPHPKYPNDPRSYLYAYITIPKLYFNYNSLDEFINDFSEVDRIIYKIRNNNDGTVIELFNNNDKYYLTNITEDTIDSTRSNILEILDRITLEDIENINSINTDEDNSIYTDDIKYVKYLIKYLMDNTKTHEENYEYIKNNGKLFVNRYVFGYNTRIAHNKEN